MSPAISIAAITPTWAVETHELDHGSLLIFNSEHWDDERTLVYLSRAVSVDEAGSLDTTEPDTIMLGPHDLSIHEARDLAAFLIRVCDQSEAGR